MPGGGGFKRRRIAPEDKFHKDRGIDAISRHSVPANLEVVPQAHVFELREL